jgi:ribosomal-protein-alanine N-acetyltransferase
MSLPLIIEVATPDDLSAIERIEQRAYPFPWKRSVLKNAIASDDAFSFFYVARLCEVSPDPGRIIGYHYFWVVADEVHILNIAVDPAYQRRGYAGRLLEFAFTFGQQQGANCAFLEVRASNRIAQQVYAHLGFQQIRLRKAYYSNNQEDAYVLKKWFQPGAQAPG